MAARLTRIVAYQNIHFGVIPYSHFISGYRDETNLRQLSAADCIGFQWETSDVPPIVRMVSPRHRSRSIEAWTKSSLDEKPGGGTEDIAHTGFECVRTIGCRRLFGDIRGSRNVRGAVHPRRRAGAGIRKNAG